MTPQELYKLLNKAGVDFEVTEMFEGVRYLRVEVIEDAVKCSYASKLNKEPVDHDLLNWLNRGSL